VGGSRSKYEPSLTPVQCLFRSANRTSTRTLCADAAQSRSACIRGGGGLRCFFQKQDAGKAGDTEGGKRDRIGWKSVARTPSDSLGAVGIVLQLASGLFSTPKPRPGAHQTAVLSTVEGQFACGTPPRGKSVLST